MWKRFGLVPEENLVLELEKVEGKGEEWMERKLLWERRWIPPAQKHEWVEDGGGGRRESDITAIEIEIEIELWRKVWYVHDFNARLNC